MQIIRENISNIVSNELPYKIYILKTDDNKIKYNKIKIFFQFFFYYLRKFLKIKRIYFVKFSKEIKE